ncbi:50S ribosomal protein L29 [Almyronema epifaneia]|uniref:Large ribosomal subunit protein uL29 n=1 Tax=Almyronema epifaneia S1 TaxID=2991925 RepID=A0ABW6IHS2_9CYAN
MPLPKIEDARKLSDQELADEIVAVKRELFQLRFQKATRQLETEVHRFKHANHRLSQMMTIQRQRQLTATSVSDQEPGSATSEE